MIPETTFQALRQAVPGVRFLTGEADLAAYSYDAALDRARPDAVVLAQTAEEVEKTVRACATGRIPSLPRGAGTNLSGGCIPLKGGVVISTVLMNRVLSIDTRSRIACVEPGVVNLLLQEALEPLGFFYAPDPASHRICTLGGNVAENAGGPACLKYGVTSNHVTAVEAVMPDGRLERFSVEDPGPDMCGLLVGSEGTLGVVTKIWVRFLPVPETIRTLLAAFGSVEDAVECVSEIIASGILPRTLEAMDRMTVKAVEDYMHAGYPREAESVLLIELDGPPDRSAQEARAVEAVCRRCRATEVRAARDEAERERLWEGRRGAYAAMARLAPNVLVEDGVVPRNRLPEAVRRVKEIAAANGVQVSLLFHAGDGNLHPNIIFDERDAGLTARVRQAGHEMLKACVELDGSISGEHGIGSDKRKAMAWLFSAETLALFRRVKEAFDPENLSNPGKIIPLEGEAEEGVRSLRPNRPLTGSARFLAETVRERARTGEPFTAAGYGTGLSTLSLRDHAGGFVSTRPLDSLIELDEANYTVTAEAGIRVEELVRSAGSKGLHLSLPSWPGSLGGLLATRPWTGLRDQVLGMRVLLATGEVVELGGKVMKNVAGYDLQRLLLGSWGGYGIILEATLKAFPRPVDAPGAVPVPRLFTPNRWHLRLKDAFDPKHLLNPWLFGTWTASIAKGI